MKKTIFHLWGGQLFSMPTLYLLIFGLGLQEQASAQEWDGAANTTGDIYRTGFVGVGINSTTYSNLVPLGVLALEGDLFFIRGSARTIRGGSRASSGTADDLTVKAGGYAVDATQVIGEVTAGNLFLTGGDASLEGLGGRVEIIGSQGLANSGETIYEGGNITVNGGNPTNNGLITITSGLTGEDNGNINILSGTGLTNVGVVPLAPAIENSDNVRLFVQNNIGVWNAGQFGSIVGNNRWTSIGDRVPFATTAGFASTGVRSQWGDYSSNVGLLERPTGNIRDAVFEWQDLNVVGPGGTQGLDPTTLPQLKFRFRTGELPASEDPRFLDVMNLTATGNVGIGVANPDVRIDALKESGVIADGDPTFAYRFNHTATFDGAGDLLTGGVFRAANNSGANNAGSFVRGLLSSGEGAATDVIGITGIASLGSLITNTNTGVEGIANNTNAFRNIGVVGNAAIVASQEANAYTVGVWGNVGVVRDPGEVLGENPLNPENETDPELSRTWGVFSTGDFGLTGDFYGFSDKKLKTNIKPLSSLGRFKKLSTYNYTYDESKEAVKNLGLRTNKVHYGFIAQEVKEFFPELVQERPFIRKSGDKTFVENVQAFNQIEMIPIVASALKETIEKMDSLEKVLNSLTQLNTVLTSSQKLENVLAEGLGLSDAIPNPTSERTYLNVTLPANCQKALLTVVNVAGKIVFEQTVEPKDTQIVLEAKNWGAGMYICNLTAPLFKPVVKTVIVR